MPFFTRPEFDTAGGPRSGPASQASLCDCLGSRSDRRPIRMLATGLLYAVISVGCSDTSEVLTVESRVLIDGPPPPVATTGSPDTGPQGGELFELGLEARFHAELVRLPGREPVLRILGGGAVDSVPIATPEIFYNTTIGTSPVSLVFTASPVSGDSADRSSRFICRDAGAAEVISNHNTEATLALRIKGRGLIGRRVTAEHGH